MQRASPPITFFNSYGWAKWLERLPFHSMPHVFKGFNMFLSFFYLSKDVPLGAAFTDPFLWMCQVAPIMLPTRRIKGPFSMENHLHILPLGNLYEDRIASYIDFCSLWSDYLFHEGKCHEIYLHFVDLVLSSLFLSMSLNYLLPIINSDILQIIQGNLTVYINKMVYKNKFTKWRENICGWSI